MYVCSYVCVHVCMYICIHVHIQFLFRPNFATALKVHNKLKDKTFYFIFYYQLYKLDNGGTQKAKPIQGVYLKSRSLRNKRLNKLR